MLVIGVQLLLFVLGLAVVAVALRSAISTFVLPRSASDPLTNIVFLLVRQFFWLRLRSKSTYNERDRVMALYAPIGLLALPPAWLACVCVGYTLIYRAIGSPSWHEAFFTSGSSLLTLGNMPLTSVPESIISFSEATLGLILVTVLISYLPTMYSAFSRREVAVNLLDVRAGSPPSAVEMLTRYYRIHGFSELGEVWKTWEAWFADIEETHTSLAALAPLPFTPAGSFVGHSRRRGVGCGVAGGFNRRHPAQPRRATCACARATWRCAASPILSAFAITRTPRPTMASASVARNMMRRANG